MKMITLYSWEEMAEMIEKDPSLIPNFPTIINKETIETLLSKYGIQIKVQSYAKNGNSWQVWLETLSKPHQSLDYPLRRWGEEIFITIPANDLGNNHDIGVFLGTISFLAPFAHSSFV